MKANFLVSFVLLACLAGLVRSRTLNRDSCPTKACKPSSKFRYEAGTTYSYDYSIQTETSIDGASENRAVLSISGQADIEVIDQCDLALVMKGVRIHESRPSESRGLMPSARGAELSRVLESQALRFSFQDGVVQELCVDRRDDPWALNVKRGLLSAMQNSMDRLHGSQTVQESDVSGTCKTQYQVTSEGYWGKTSIRRNKDLMGCTGRHSYSGSLQTAHYHSVSELQSVPLMTSEHECVQEVYQGIIQSSTCTEKHLFRPFSSEGSGAQTTVLQKLTFSSQRRGVTSRRAFDTRAEMAFDHGYGIKDSNEAREQAEKVLSTLCDVTSYDIRPEVPRLFSQLVSAVTKMDRDDIRIVHHRLERRQMCSSNNQRTKKFLLDAVAMAGSEASVSMMKDLLVSGEVQGLEADLWLNALAFIPAPTADMIRSVQELLQSDSLKAKALLPMSTMVHNHCDKVGCFASPAVDSILDTVEKTIGYRCSVNDGNIKTVLLALKALGNAGQSRSVDVIGRCLNYRVPLEVRVAAAQAFRRMPCDSDKSQLISLLKENSEATEIRITSYLQIITCPTPEILNSIQTIMQDEPEESQVGSFILSHLTNLMETESPLRQDARRLVKDVQLSRMFEMNPLKFSRNYEKSLFLQAVNSGFQAEADVIFAAESPVPRSVSSNLTVDLFGHSINLLELGGRLEGVEYLIEAVQYSIAGNGYDKASRKKLDELKGSAFLRIFGNELAYDRFEGLSSQKSGSTFNVLDFLIKLSKDHDYSFTQSLQFLDGSMTIPTTSGLPLTLSVNGTAVVDVMARGKLDLRKVSKTPRSVYIDGEIRPSGAVTVDGVMSVDGLLTKPGLKVSSSLHSSVTVKGRVELDRGRILNLQMDMPDRRQDVLDVRTKFFIMHDKIEEEQDMIKEGRKELELCSGDFISKATGLELCGQLQFPNASMKSSGPYFPLTGPSSLSIVLHKRDSHTGYKILAKRVENKRSSIAQLSFDTPGSSVVRAVSFDVMVNYPEKEAEISFASPWKKTSVKGSLVNDAGMKSITGSVVVDDDKIYSITSELKVDEQKEKRLTVFTPLVKVRAPGLQTKSLTGTVQMDSRGLLFSSDVTVTGVLAKPLQLKGAMTNTQTEKSLSGSAIYGKKTYSAEAGSTYSIRSGRNMMAQFNPRVVLSSPAGEALRLEGTTDFKQNKMLVSSLTITAPDMLRKPINLQCNVVKKGRRRGTRYNMDVRVKSRPFTGKLNGFVNVADTVATKLSVDYNVYRGSRDRVTINGKLSNKSTAALRKYTVTSTVNFKNKPDLNFQTSVDFDHKKKRSGGQVILRYGKDFKDKSRQVRLSASVDRKITDITDMDIDYKMKVVAPIVDLDTSIMGSHSHKPTAMSSKVAVNYDKGKTVKAAVNLKNKSDRQIRMNGDASLSFPGHNYEMDSSLKKNGRQYQHSINMKTHDGPLLTATSTYTTSRDNLHDMSSEIQVGQQPPIKVSGVAGLDPKDLQLLAQVLHADSTYSVNAQSKITRGPRGRWSVELVHPTRVIAASAIGGMQKNSVDMDAELAWDKNVDDSAKITFNVNGKHKSSRDGISASGKVELTSPFTILDRLSASVSYDDESTRYGLDGKVTVGGNKADTYYSTLSAAKPLSPRNVQVSWQAGSPVRGYRRLEASVQHTMDDRSLSSTLKTTRGRSQMQISINGNDNSRRGNIDISGDVALKSDMPGFEDVVVSLAGKNNGNQHELAAALTRNGDRYAADLDMRHSGRDWRIRNNGKLEIISPEHGITTSWQHRSSDDDISSTLTSNWGRNKELKVVISGDKQLSGPTMTANGAVTIRSPWKSMRELSVNVKNELSLTSLKHKAAIVHNGQKKASTEVNYVLREGDASGDFAVSTPYTEDKSGNARLQYSGYPITAQITLQMAPRTAISGDMSFSRPRIGDMEGSLRLTTPFRALRTLSASASSKREGDDRVIKANLDSGIRQGYDIEIRIRPQDLSLCRIKINTPIEGFSYMETGYEISGDLNSFDGKSDFEVRPTVAKTSTSFNWRLSDELSAILRVNLPIHDLRFLQLTVSSTNTAKGRKNRVEFEHYPRVSYSLTSFHTTRLPIILSLNAETPIPDYEHMGLSFRHDHTDTSVNTHGEVQYLPDRTIESTLGLTWHRNVEGSLVFKTPFAGYEESKLTLRHDGDIDDFTSHAEASALGETMVADAQFKSGYSTSGSFSFETSLEDIEKIEANFNKRGNLKNFRSSASLSYGDQKMEGSAQHNLNNNLMKTVLSFTSPITEDAKASVELTKQPGTHIADLKVSYGDRFVEKRSTIRTGRKEFSTSTIIDYNMIGQRQAMASSFAFKGDKSDFVMGASASSPYYQDIAFTMVHFCNMPHTLANTIEANYGTGYSIKTVNKMDNRQSDFTASSINNFKMGGPSHEAIASVSKTGEIDDMSISGSAKYDDNEIKIDGELNMKRKLIAKLNANTPFEGFEGIGAELTHKPTDRGFEQNGQVTYKKNRKISHAITFNNQGLRSIELDAFLNTPFSPMERTDIKVSHTYSRNHKKCQGSVELNSMLGAHVLKYERTGDLDHIIVDGSLQNLGENIIKGKIERVPLTNGYKHALDVTWVKDRGTAAAEYQISPEQISVKATGSANSDSFSVEGEASLRGLNAEASAKGSLKTRRSTKTATMSARKTGPWNDVSMEIQGSVPGSTISANAKFQKAAEDISGTLKIKTPFQGFSDIGGFFKHSGSSLDRFNSEGGVTYMDDQDISGKVNFYRYRLSRLEASAELTTPFAGLRSTKAEYRHSGSADSFTCTASAHYGKSQEISSDLKVTMSPKYDATLTVKTPFKALRRMVAETKLESVGNAHSGSASLDIGRSSRYSAEGSVDLDSTPMTLGAKLTTPIRGLRRLEVSGSHQGGLDDFSTALSFTSPQTDKIKADATFRFQSVFDMGGSASLSSEISGLEKLRLEVKNSDLGDSKSGHVLAKWAEQRQVTVDGSFLRKDYGYSKQLEADLSLATPFDVISSANMHVQHEQKNGRHAPLLRLTVDGDKLLDLEGEVTTGDDPSASLTSRHPWPAQMTASLTKAGDERQGELFVNWDRDHTDSNVRLQTRAKDISNYYGRDLDYSAKVIFPTKTLSSGITLTTQSKSLKSDGYVAWDDRAGRKVFYSVEMNDKSQYRRQVYDGTVKLGVPGRTVAASSSLSKVQMTTAVDTTLAWDADRDSSKQVAVSAKVVAGDRTKADLTLRLPAIGKEVHIEHEMAVNKDRVVFDGTTSLSYSTDPSKTITLHSSIKDVSDYYSSGKNYSVNMAVSQPHTNTDISLTTHIGASSNHYSAAMNTVYLTSRRQRKNMILRGEIDRIRRQIDLQLESPVKKVSVQGHIQSTEPYVITVSNTIDDAYTTKSKLNIDLEGRTLEMITHYDGADSDKRLVLEAGYRTPKVFLAQVSRHMSDGRTVSDAVLTTRLNTSTLIHTRLAWRPEMMADVQTFAAKKFIDIEDSGRIAVDAIAEGVGEELGAKYSAYTEELEAELSPLLDLLQSEMARLGQQLERSRKAAVRYYRRNDLHLKDAGDMVLNAIKSMKSYNDAYLRTYRKTINSFRRSLEDMKNYNIREKYDQLIETITDEIITKVVENFELLDDVVAYLDERLSAIKASTNGKLQEIQNHPHVQRMKQRVHRLGEDYQWLMGHLSDRAQQLSLPEQYTSAIYGARDTIGQGLQSAMSSRQVKKAKAAANEIYQQGAWAYKYWQVEEKSKQHLHSLVQLLKDVATAQLRAATDKLNVLRDTNVTVYDPAGGQVQVDIRLPFPMTDLQTPPDVIAFLDDAEKVIDRYVPDIEDVVDLYNKYAPWISNETKPQQGDIMSQFKTYEPSRRQRRPVLYRNRRVRGM